MFLRFAFFLSLTSAMLLGASVIKISKDKLSMAITHELGTTWRVGDKACVNASGGQKICGQVTKVKKAGAICKMTEPLKGVSEGDEVTAENGLDGEEGSIDNPLEGDSGQLDGPPETESVKPQKKNKNRIGLGIKGGVNLANISKEDPQATETNSRTSLDIGVMVDIPFGQSAFGLEPGIYFVHRGDDSANVGKKFAYIDLRLLLKARFIQGDFTPVIYAGPYAGLLLSQVLSTSLGETDQKEMYQSLDFGLMGGLGFEFKVSSSAALGLSGYYSFGLTNILKDSTYAQKHKGINVLGHLIFRI